MKTAFTLDTSVFADPVDVNDLLNAEHAERRYLYTLYEYNYCPDSAVH